MTFESVSISPIGSVEYEIYKKDSQGSLVKIGNTSSTSFTATVSEPQVTFVVKSTYTILKSALSSGTEVNTIISANNIPITTDDESTSSKDKKEDAQEESK